MPACAVRYRLNAAGPLAYLVEYEGRFFIYTRGALGAALPATRVAAMLTDRVGKWVTAGGELVVDGLSRSRMARPSVTPTANLFEGALPHA